MKVWEENKCHSESLCSEKQCFRDCPFLTFYWGVAFICKGNCLFCIFLNFTLIQFYIQYNLFYEYSSVSFEECQVIWQPSSRSKIENISLTPKSPLVFTLAAPLPHGQSWWPVSASAMSTSCAAQPDIVEPRMLYVWTVWPLLWLSIYDDFMHLTSCPGIVFTCLWAALAWASSFTGHPYADFFFFEIHEDLKNPCMWNSQPLGL